MLSEKHIAHHTDSQHRKKSKNTTIQHQYKHEYTKLTAADYNFLSRYVLSCSLEEFSDCVCMLNKAEDSAVSMSKVGLKKLKKHSGDAPETL